MVEGEEIVKAISEHSSVFEVVCDNLSSSAVITSHHYTCLLAIDFAVGQESFVAFEGSSEAITVGAQKPDGVTSQCCIKIAAECSWIECRHVVCDRLIV